ncbi:MAG: hypothetical protein HF982_15215 [Desulfobacteraceae bacterium]|nr:hypothetical protein [Desulfobacteraceae bacterium]MBC2720906.1 hypothetical protein [Desulfobacteraceae bacterium]
MISRYLFFIIIISLFINDCLIPCKIIAGNYADYAVQAEFIPKEAAPGDIITLRLSFEIPVGFKLPDNPKITGLKNFDILNKINRANGIEIDMFVDSMEDINLPGLEIYVYDQDGKQKTLKSNPAILAVKPLIKVKPAENLLRPIKGLISTEYGIKRILLLIMASVLIILVIIAVYFIFKYHQRRKLCPEVPAQVPYLKALSRIDELVAQGIPNGKEGKAFCFILSEILREYMGAIRNFNALEMTTHEIAGLVKDKGDVQLLNLLKRIDLVKFADAVMSKTSFEEQVSLSLEYINQTKPKEV